MHYFVHGASIHFLSFLKAQLTDRYLIFQWVCGVVCAVVTCLNFFVTPWRMQKTPLWIGFIGNFSFVVFSYMYIVGILIQDYDAGRNVLLTTLGVLLAFLMHPFCSVLESASVLYAIFTQPTEFEVIRK